MFWGYVWILIVLFCYTCGSWAVQFTIVEVVYTNYTLTKAVDTAVCCCSCSSRVKVAVVNVEHTIRPSSEQYALYLYSTHNSTLFFPCLA